jgi:hypothetical protein
MGYNNCWPWRPTQTLRAPRKSNSNLQPRRTTDIVTAFERLKRNKTMTLVDEFHLDKEHVHKKQSVLKKLQRSLSDTFQFMKYIQRSSTGELLSISHVEVAPPRSSDRDRPLKGIPNRLWFDNPAFCISGSMRSLPAVYSTAGSRRSLELGTRTCTPACWCREYLVDTSWENDAWQFQTGKPHEFHKKTLSGFLWPKPSAKMRMEVEVRGC